MMTDSTTKSAKSVAPETVRLFEIIGFGKTNEEEYKSKVQNIMEVTGCEQVIAILTLHDCNDENEAIQRLLDSNAGSTQEGWKIKKKDRKKKSAQESFENELPDTPKAYVTDGHSTEPGVEGRRGVKSREKDRDSYGGWKDRKSGHKESGGSWDGEETELPKAEDSPRTERDRPAKNGYSNKPRPRYSNENKYDRRDREGDRNEDRQNSRVFVNRQNERYQQDGEERYPRERNDRYSWDREDQNRKFKRRPYEDRNRDRSDWESSKYSRDFIDQETEDKPRRREKRSDKEPIIFDSTTNRSSKTTDINGDFYVNSSENADAIDWDNPVLSKTDWGAEEKRKQSDEDVDEDKRIEAILSEGWEFCNPNFDHEDVKEPQIILVPPKPANESTGISTSHSYPIPDNLHPIYSPQTTSLPTPSAAIPESRPHSHHQAMGDMFNRLDKMNIKRKTRSKIPQAPVELPALTVDSYDIQFGNVVSLPVAPQEPEDDFKFTDSPSPVDDKTFSNANFHDSELTTSNEQTSPPAPKSNERPAATDSPPLKSDVPLPPRSPVPQEKQPSLSAPPSQQTAAPAQAQAPPHSQPAPHYHQHLGRQNERKGNYSENSGKLHHHGGMSGNSVKMQQHPQMAPVNSIDQQPGMPYMMTGPMGSMGLQTHTAPNSLPATTMSNIPRGLGKNYQPPVIYNTPGGQFSMMPSYYYEPEMMRMIASQNNNPATNMVKDQNSNPVFPNNDSKFHEPTSPANAQSGIQGQNVYLPFPGYGFFPNIFPVMPKNNTFPNPVTAAGQTPFQTPPPMPPNLTAMSDQLNEYKASFSNVPQKTGAMPQATDLQNMYKSFEQKSAIPFGFGYPMAQYMTPQMMPPLSQQQPQYSSLNPNMLLQQPLDTQRPKW